VLKYIKGLSFSFEEKLAAKPTDEVDKMEQKVATAINSMRLFHLIHR
jgi:hypothetical protein